MHTFGDERHLSSLRVMLTLQTAPLVSALFIMVAMNRESCYLSAIRASAFFFLCAIVLHIMFPVVGGGPLCRSSVVIVATR